MAAKWPARPVGHNIGKHFRQVIVDYKKKKMCSELKGHRTPRMAMEEGEGELLSKLYCKFIAKDLCPYSVVENQGFHATLCTLQPRYDVPS